jgi:hypothetical protein
VVEEVPSTDEISPPALPPPPGSDRKTRGFRVHIEPRTHNVTRTNKKQKLTSTVKIKQEPVDVSDDTSIKGLIRTEFDFFKTFFI